MDATLEGKLVCAFPAALTEDVRAVARSLPWSRLQPKGSVTVRVGDEQLAIPGRIYNPEPATSPAQLLPPAQAKILHCLYTRHHDGYTRQRHLTQIISHTDPWIVPFVVQLIGEYVLQIVITIKEGLADLDLPGSPHHQAYGQFTASNPGFVFLTSQRVTSYWNCYYRNRYPHQYYPGRILIDSLKQAAATQHDTLATDPA
jgi:hypothetical protein